MIKFNFFEEELKNWQSLYYFDWPATIFFSEENIFSPLNVKFINFDKI